MQGSWNPGQDTRLGPVSCLICILNRELWCKLIDCQGSASLSDSESMELDSKDTEDAFSESLSVEPQSEDFPSTVAMTNSKCASQNSDRGDH